MARLDVYAARPKAVAHRSEISYLASCVFVLVRRIGHGKVRVHSDDVYVFKLSYTLCSVNGALNMLVSSGEHA